MSSTLLHARPRVDVHLSADDIRRSLVDDVRAGLGGLRKSLPPKWFYDDRGSELFDAITRLPEYYPTEIERAILRKVSPSVAALSGATTIVELGSGTSDKTRTLLDAFVAEGALKRFVAFDVSEATLRAAADMLIRRYPDIEVQGVVGDFERHLPLVSRVGKRMFVLLGSTIGNFPRRTRGQFLRSLRDTTWPGESILLGFDLVKGVDRLVAAYDDSAGVTAEFNRNVLHVINRELNGDLKPEAFAHRASWNPDEEAIEMHLVATKAMVAHIREAQMVARFIPGETIHTETSAKFRPETMHEELERAGFHLACWWNDIDCDYAVALAFRKEA